SLLLQVLLMNLFIDPPHLLYSLLIFVTRSRYQSLINMMENEIQRSFVHGSTTSTTTRGSTALMTPRGLPSSLTSSMVQLPPGGPQLWTIFLLLGTTSKR